jgi:hypothetical protein
MPLFFQLIDGFDGHLDVGDIFPSGFQIARFDRIHPTGDLDDGRGIKGFGKFLRVDGGRCDDDLQVPPAVEQLLENSQDKIDIEAALVGFIDDDGVVSV